MGQLHLGTVDAFALTTTLQQRRQVFVEHASLLNSGIAVIKDLRQGGLQPNTVAYVTLEQDQRIQAVLGRFNAAVFLLVLCQFERRLRWLVDPYSAEDCSSMSNNRSASAVIEFLTTCITHKDALGLAGLAMGLSLVLG